MQNTKLYSDNLLFNLQPYFMETYSKYQYWFQLPQVTSLRYLCIPNTILNDAKHLLIFLNDALFRKWCLHTLYNFTRKFDSTALIKNNVNQKFLQGLFIPFQVINITN